MRYRSVILETSRLVIRELTVDDADFVLRLTNDPAFVSNIGDKGIRNLEDARRFLRDGAWTNQPVSGYGQFLVVLKEDGSQAGICGLLYRENLDLTDVGFALLPEYRGRGLALEAARAVMQYGRSTLGVSRIFGLTTSDNARSIKVLDELGLKFQEIVKMSDDDPGTALYG